MVLGMNNNLYEIVFWGGVITVSYTYIGYGILLFFLVRIKRMVFRPHKKAIETGTNLNVTFIVCAFNESSWIINKIHNSLACSYPQAHIRFVFVTDGSQDDTPAVATMTFANYPANVEWYVIHEPERKGKIAAFHRAMLLYGTWPDYPPDQHIIISTDANTLLNQDALLHIVNNFNNPAVGAVAGEKRIRMEEKNAASAAGEGLYWRYESQLKRWDSELYSVVGAAGELFAFRSSVYEAVPHDTLVEDFYLTMRIAMHGHRVVYEPRAYAVETSSSSVSEEMKRKVRIAAGSLQVIPRLLPVLNPFRYGVFSFQYISHKVLRWTLAPLFLPLIFWANSILVFGSENQGAGATFFQFAWISQVLFYLFAVLGYIFERRQMKVKIFFVPYYFCLMNYAMYAGLFRLMRGRQSVLWEKSQRAV